MADFFDISAPPQSLDALDSWGGLDSLPASLDSDLWNRAGLWGLRIGEAARTSASLSATLIARLAGQGRARSSGSLNLRCLRCGEMGSTAGARPASCGLTLLRLRSFCGSAPARSGGSLLGVGVLYIGMGGVASGLGGLRSGVTFSLEGRVSASAFGALDLHFVRILSADGHGALRGGLDFGPKGWHWQGAPSAVPQSWKAEAPAQGRWQETPPVPAQAWAEGEHNIGFWQSPEPQRRPAWL